jgi:hypothetical protein
MHDQSSIESSLADHHDDQGGSWKESSGAHQCDVSVESPWRLLREEDLDHFSHHASDEEHEENDSSHDHNNRSNAIHNLLSIERQLPLTIESKSILRMVDTTRDRHGGAISSSCATNGILGQADSLSFRRLSPRKSDEPTSMNKEQRSSDKKSRRRLNRHCAVKEHIPQFAVIEWDEDLLKRHVNNGMDSSCDAC